MPDPYYLALDPGKTTGWASFDAEGNGISMGQVNVIGLFEMLRDTTAQVFICEDYKLFPWKKDEQVWSRLDTVRFIGAIQHHCWLNERTFVLQTTGNRDTGYLWAGLQKAKSHKNSHERDAYAHGVYYLQKLGVRKPQQGRVV